MNTLKTDGPSEKSQILLTTLKTAVANALEKKRRLGQYAVVWKNGKPVRLSFDVGEASIDRTERL